MSMRRNDWLGTIFVAVGVALIAGDWWHSKQFDHHWIVGIGVACMVLGAHFISQAATTSGVSFITSKVTSFLPGGKATVTTTTTVEPPKPPEVPGG